LGTSNEIVQCRRTSVVGSFASLSTRLPDVSLSPNRGARADISGPQLRANSGSYKAESLGKVN